MKLPENWQVLIEQNFIEHKSLFDRPAQIISSEESDTENNDADHVDAVEEEIIKTLQSLP